MEQKSEKKRTSLRTDGQIEWMNERNASRKYQVSIASGSCCSGYAGGTGETGDAIITPFTPLSGLIGLFRTSLIIVNKQHGYSCTVSQKKIETHLISSSSLSSSRFRRDTEAILFVFG